MTALETVSRHHRTQKGTGSNHSPIRQKAAGLVQAGGFFYFQGQTSLMGGAPVPVAERATDGGRELPPSTGRDPQTPTNREIRGIKKEGYPDPKVIPATAKRRASGAIKDQKTIGEKEVKLWNIRH